MANLQLNTITPAVLKQQRIYAQRMIDNNSTITEMGNPCDKQEMHQWIQGTIENFSDEEIEPFGRINDYIGEIITAIFEQELY